MACYFCAFSIEFFHATTGRPRTEVRLEEEQRDFLRRLVARRSAPAREILHARIILLSSEGLSNKEVAKRLSTCEHTVSHWRRRFGRLGLEGLSEMPRPGAPRRISDEESRGCCAPLWKKPRRWPPIGARVLWLRGSDFLGRPFIVSGELSACSLIARKSSLFPRTPTLSTRCATSWDSIGTHPTMLWCSVWTKRAKSRPSSAVSPCCQCDRVAPRVGAMTTIGMHHFALCRSGCSNRSGHWSHQIAPSKPGICELSASN